MTATERPVLNDRYEIQQRIGRGGMADVFMARDLLLNRPVAIKVLFPEFAADPNFVERFRREAQAAANLNHPNIVGVFDWGRFDGTYFMAMEYVQGRTLAEILKANKRLTTTQAVDVTSEVAAALGFAHRNGVVHRDIKPANILVGNDGRVKVADFGIARALNSAAEQGLTQAGAVMGTATYLSPEQAQGSQPDPRSDLYSLGVVMYEMVSGRPPFSGDSPVAIAYKQVHGAPQPLNQIVDGIPRPYEAIVAKLLAKNPTLRYPAAEALRDDLRRFKDGQPVAALAGATGATAAVASTAGAATASTGGNGARVVPRPNKPPPDAGASTATRTIAATAVQPRGPYGGGGAPPVGYYEAPRHTSGVLIAAFVALALLVGGGVFAYVKLTDEKTTVVEAITVTVPEVRGVSLEAAENILRDAGLEPEAQAVAKPDALPNIVYDQDPTPNQVVEDGSKVIITYNPDETVVLVEMPNLEGLPLEDALAKIEALGLDTDKVTTEERQVDGRVPGTVVEQSPARDTQVAKDTNITLAVAIAPDQVEVPDVAAMPLAEAQQALEVLRFKVDVIEEVSDDVEVGRVIRSEPAKGEKLDPESRVTIVVSLGKEQVVVPDLEGFTENQARQALQDLELKAKVGVPIDLPAGDPRDGTVVLQTPSKGSTVDKGTTVTMRIGKAGVARTTVATTTSTSTTTTSTSTTTTTTTTTTVAPTST